MDKELIKKAGESAGLQLSDEQIKQFCDYADFLVEYNKKVNLTAITEDEDIAVKHFEDSVALLRFKNELKSVVDVGTGAGFPSVPLKIASPDISLTLLDSLKKRLTFLELLCKRLKISAKTVHSRAEDAGKKELREAFDTAVSRAVANLSILCEYCVPLIKVGGYFYAYKSGNCDIEIENARNIIKKLGGKIEEVFEFSLSNGEKRKIIAIKKISQTPTKYPRNTAQIKKETI
ncbi:MAG: 16S rRNA (guanine(527)-N(7))-methyltransferase RsmG [Clostridia bacterium]|nr:16S rRNA (guanine(527)-N(7))-methyltransferase RsmG [Clostridia bacterium]